MSILEEIYSPSDLKKIEKAKLPELASEIRSKIIQVTSENGGHLASSLGAVELAIALHYVFDTPHDRLIWDVGHQAYAHKILTGRAKAFESLRQAGGISGFPRVQESPYDAFSTGHSSTSISAGLGMAHAAELKKEKKKVVAVIGDGSMTAGLAYEALNHAGDSKGNLLVILNDNDMSISPNVGALSSFLSRTFSIKYIQDFRSEFGRFLKSLPKIGDNIYQFAKKSEESFKAFVTPGMLFEAFNFDYFGPIKGHRLDHLIDILENIKNLEEPVLLHVLTRKGAGYPPAEKNPTAFHGISPFDIKTGEKKPESNLKPSYTEIFGKSICLLAEKNEDITAVTAAMPEGTGLSSFAKKFSRRFFDVGIAEQHALTFAAGMAKEGMRPVVAIYSTFLQRAYDSLVHDICLDAHPVILAIDRAGFVGDDGPTHHGLLDIAILRPLANILLMAPRNEAELVRMLKTAIAHKGPSAIRYPRGKGTGEEIDYNCEPLETGRAEVLKEGKDGSLIALGPLANEALKASEILLAKGFDVEVINPRFIKPLDRELFAETGKKGKLIVSVEEGVLAGGFGSALLEFFNDNNILCPVRRIGVKDTLMPHAKAEELRKACKMDAEGIASVFLEFQEEKNER